MASSLLNASPWPQPPLIIAHRGASGYRPEHTLESYRLAIALGCDYIEPDLVITRDGVLIARHENELSETTDVGDRPEFGDRRTTKVIDGLERTGWFAEDFSLAEIKSLRARQRLPCRSAAYNDQFVIPTFAEVIALAQQASQVTGRRIGIYPETKHPSYFQALGLPLEPPLLAQLEATGYTGRDAPVMLQSFETANLQALRAQTQVPLVQLMDEPHLRQADSQRPYAELLTPGGLEAIAQYADGIGVEKRAIVPQDSANPTRLLPPTALVPTAHAAGLKVHVYTFRSDGAYLHPAYDGDPVAEYDQFFQLGVDGVFSDFTDHAVAGRDRHWPAAGSAPN
jgi:glycerophosphoryl diester phosphodiesterase